MTIYGTYSSYIDLKCLLCVDVTVKIQFDNTSTYILAPCMVAILDGTFGPPYSEILDPPLQSYDLKRLFSRTNFFIHG